MNNRMTRPALGGLFPLIVRRAGEIPHHGSAAGQATAFVAILHASDQKRAVVVMADGNYGASITNCAEELVTFLHRFHLEPLPVALADIRWIYRDSEGNWDEIVPSVVHGTQIYCVNYRPLGGRALKDVMDCVAAEGVSLCDDDKALLVEYLAPGPQH